MAINTDSRILIVGAGCFGLSTAYHLLKRGFRDVLILDRSSVLPAPDAASTDLNKSEFTPSLRVRLYEIVVSPSRDLANFSRSYLVFGHLLRKIGEGCDRSLERPKGVG